MKHRIVCVILSRLETSTQNDFCEWNSRFIVAAVSCSFSFIWRYSGCKLSFEDWPLAVNVFPFDTV